MSRKRNRRGKRNAQSRNRNRQERMAGQPSAAGMNPVNAPAAKAVQQTEQASVVVALDPLAPLVVRSGRPFDSQAGPDPARFPPPSTVAGCLRTAWARQEGQDFGLHLRELPVSGPLLLDGNQVLVPKPADAHYFGAEACTRAEPRLFAAGCCSDLPRRLVPVQLTKKHDSKPVSGPLWWSLRHLLDFRRGIDVSLADLTSQGWSPTSERRTHVAIDRERGAADEGKLFQTEGLVLDGAESGDAAQGGLRLLARCGKELRSGLVHLGGERRLAALEPQSSSTWPTPPDGWLRSVADAGGVCLTLLTPAIFSMGFRPGWLDAELIGSPPTAPSLTLQLQAVAVDRWQPHSGWDLKARQPRPTRKLAPAGATYWFRIVDGADEEALGHLWLANVSDEEQDRRDGFGLALPSAWHPPVDIEERQ